MDIENIVIDNNETFSNELNFGIKFLESGWCAVSCYS